MSDTILLVKRFVKKTLNKIEILLTIERLFATIIVLLLKGVTYMAMIYDTSPTGDEAAMARLSYLQWERSNAEELAEYVYRRRTVDLAYLVSQVMQDELTKSERAAVEKVCYEQKPIIQAANELGVNRATLARTLDRVTAKLEHSLKYAVMYQYNLHHVEFLPAAVRQAFALNAVRHYEPKSVGECIRCLRESEGISLCVLADTSGIERDRLEKLEHGEEQPLAAELVSLSAYFGTTADYLLNVNQKV